MFTQAKLRLSAVLLHRKIAEMIQPERPGASVKNTILPRLLTALLVVAATYVSFTGRSREPGHLHVPALLGAPLPASVRTTLPTLLTSLPTLLVVSALPTLLAASAFSLLLVLGLVTPVVVVAVTILVFIGRLHLSLCPDFPGTPPEVPYSHKLGIVQEGGLLHTEARVGLQNVIHES